MAVGFRESQEFWREQAKFEARVHHELRNQQGKGPYNIFIIDTSSFIEKEGFAQLKEAFTAIIDEYSQHPDIDENVAVIVCGRQTKFLRYYSNQYEDIKHCLDNVEIGGPCPLTAAFILSQGGLGNGTNLECELGDFYVRPRIILISVGRPTDFSIIDADLCPQMETDEDKHRLLQQTQNVGRIHPIFCIPVGQNPDLTTLDFLSAQSQGGKIVHVSEARQFAKYSKNMITASKLSFTIENDGNDKERIMTSLVCKFPDSEFSQMDLDDIFEICSRKPLYCSYADLLKEIEDEQELYKERDPNMPPLGSRVKRGRDWQWGDQDKYGPGTVIGHSKNAGWLHIEWDRNPGNSFHYRYGSNSKAKDIYDIMVCDEPRILDNQLISLGCLVTRGPDWQYGDQDGGAGNIGSVFQVAENGMVQVRWQRGQKQYRFGYEGKMDLEICDPFSKESVESLKVQMQKAALNYAKESKAGIVRVLKDVSGLNNDHHLESTGKPVLFVTKGKYFKNDKLVEQPADIETDGPQPAGTTNQWFWKDENGKWNAYSKEMNNRVNKYYRRDPKSTVVVTIYDQIYRVVMAKNIQINIKTREVFDVKFVET